MNTFSTQIMMLAAALMLAACSGSSVSPDPSEPPTNTSQSLIEQASSLKTEAACKAEQGEWRKVGRLQRFACVLTAADAGKSCTDGSQCQVACLVEGDVTPGTEATGQCQATTNQFGCRAFVTNGKAEPALCID